MSLLLMLCCNNERGTFTGQVVAAELSRDAVELLSIECVLDGDEMAVQYGPSPTVFRLGQRAFKHGGFRKHVGNLLWDAVRVSPDVAALVVNHLIGARSRDGSHKYEVTAGLTALFGRAEVASLRMIDIIRA